MALQTLNANQIRNGVLEDRHVNGKFSEAVLDIDWKSAGHAADLLRNKSLIDYVQHTTPIKVLKSTSTATVNIALDTSDTTIPGVLLNGEIRYRTVDGDPIHHNGKEVVGKVTSSNGSVLGGFEYVITFYDSVGTPYVFENETDLEYLYPIKTNLWDALETFASNERFIDGAVDIRSRLDIEQFATDVFGPNYVFNADGVQTQVETLMELLTRLTHGTISTPSNVIDTTMVIDEVYAARTGVFGLGVPENSSLSERLTADFNFLNDLINKYMDDVADAVDVAHGTALIGHKDTGSVFGSYTVLNDIINYIGAQIKDANGSKANINERLSVSMNEDGTLKAGTQIHTHHKCAFNVPLDTTTIDLSTLTSHGLNETTIKEGVDDIEVILNGAIQAESIHYTLTHSGGFVTAIDFTPETIGTKDVLILKWTIHNQS